jgi:hypothetical protein
MQEEIRILKAQVAELLEWKRARIEQQISYPLDIASRTAIGAVVTGGLGSTTKLRQ